MILTKNIILFFGWIYILISSCSSQMTCDNCGIISANFRFLDTVTNQYTSAQEYGPDEKIWFKDSAIIDEVKTISIDHDESGKERRSIRVKYYTFIDLKTMSFYDYSSFSDTARCIKTYKRSDSANVSIGWTFFDDPPEFPIFGDPEVLPDTLIENITYKRLKFVYTMPAWQEKIKQPAIGYFRCDKKGTMFTLDKRLSSKTGCPWTRVDNIPLSPQSSAISQQISFVADRLTKEELKVFNAWERYAENNPVK